MKLDGALLRKVLQLNPKLFKPLKLLILKKNVLLQMSSELV